MVVSTCLGSWCFLALIAGAGYLIYLAVRHFTAQPHNASVAVSASDAAERILGERLARGEIDPDEYRTRLNALRGST